MKSYVVINSDSNRGSLLRVSFAANALNQVGMISSIIPLARALFRDRSTEIKPELSDNGSSQSSAILERDESEEVKYINGD